MPSLAELLGAGVKAGLQDDSFKTGYQAQSERDLAAQKAAQDLATRKSMLSEQIGQAERLRELLGPEVGVNVEGVSLQPLDQLRVAQLQQLQEDKIAAQQQKLSKQLAEQKIPETGQMLEQLGTSVKNRGFAVSPVSAALGPKLTSAVEQYAPQKLANLLGVKPGASEQLQAFEGLKAFRRNPLFGASLTANERQSFDDAFGIYSVGTPEQKQNALMQMQDIFNRAQSNVAAGYAPKVKEAYKREGGTGLSPANLGLGKKTKSIQEMSDEELKAIAGE